MKNWFTWFFKKMIYKHQAGHIDALSSIDKSVPIINHAEPEEEYEPKPGRRGKDVEWVPCSTVVLNLMFQMVKVASDDYLIDLGSGDGRMVIGAAKLGAQALGIEYNPRMVELSRKNAEKEGVSDRVTFREADFYETDFSEATVIALFLRKDINIALRPKILNMRPGSRVISNIFDMGEWQADEIVEVEDENYYFKNHTVYFWIVPARAGGIWSFPGGELNLEQNFQMIKGELTSGSATKSVTGKMIGDRISFVAEGVQYEGFVTGNRMAVETTEGSSDGWTATRSAP
jgi:precorrin-6B methylase 2